MNLDVLKTELDGDPLARGYSGMSDALTAADLRAVYRTRNLSSLTGTVVFNAIDKTEFNSKTAAQKQTVWNILHLGNVNPFGLEADLLIDIFGGGSTTITTLSAIRKENVSRGAELGLGVVREGHVQQARAI